MEMIEFQDGRKITWEEYAKEMGDTLTEYRATKEDLCHLAIALADEYIERSRDLDYQVGRTQVLELHYVWNRLGRVLEHIPEMKAEVEARLKNGLEWNKANPLPGKEVEEWFAKPLEERLRIMTWKEANPYAATMNEPTKQDLEKFGTCPRCGNKETKIYCRDEVVYLECKCGERRRSSGPNWVSLVVPPDDALDALM